MRRKGLPVLLAAVIFLFLYAHTVFAAKNNDITIVVDGIVMEFSREQPVIRDGRIFVPSCFTFFDTFGFGFRPISYFALRHEPENYLGLVRFFDHMHLFDFYLRVGDYEMVLHSIGLNREIFTVQLDVAPFNYGDNELGARMLPLRAIVEAAGFNVNWDGATRTVAITS